MQKLRDFLADSKITRRDFASLIGVDQSVLSRFCNDQARPGLETAVKIERATGGVVPASAWIPDPALLEVRADVDGQAAGATTPSEEDAA